ncbi:MAG: site-specific integrase, partial [Anaerolineae bacterium]
EKVCPGFNPHDTRRTAAALAYEAGMPLPQIQKMLRHKDPGTTLRYIGQKPDYASSNLNTYGVTFG